MAVIVQLSQKNSSFETLDPTSVGCQRVCTDSILHAIASASQSKVRSIVLTACPKISHLGIPISGSRIGLSSPAHSPAFQSIRHLCLSDLPSHFVLESLVSLLEMCSANLEQLELRGFRYAEVFRHHHASSSPGSAATPVKDVTGIDVPSALFFFSLCRSLSVSLLYVGIHLSLCLSVYDLSLFTCSLYRLRLYCPSLITVQEEALQRRSPLLLLVSPLRPMSALSISLLCAT